MTINVSRAPIVFQPVIMEITTQEEANIFLHWFTEINNNDDNNLPVEEQFLIRKLLKEFKYQLENGAR